MAVAWATRGRLAPTLTIEEPLLPAGVCAFVCWKTSVNLLRCFPWVSLVSRARDLEQVISLDTQPGCGVGGVGG